MSSRSAGLRDKGYDACQADLNNLSDIPQDFLSTAYGDLCQLYGEIQPAIR